jgi:DNA polymerase III alpha subunit
VIQLRVRSEYSFGETFAPIPRLVARLRELGCQAAGIVDRGSTWGHVRWFQECRAAGIRPLLGVELAVEGSPGAQGWAWMWFLASTQATLQGLYRLASLAHSRALPSRRGPIPWVSRADVELADPGILRFAGDCLDGEWLAKIGAIVDLSPTSRLLRNKKASIAKEFGLRVVSTSDNSYAYPDDRGIFEMMGNITLKPTPQHLLEQLDNQDEAERILALCEDYELPKAPMIRADGNLEQICREGIKQRGMAWDDRYEQRLQYELELIRSKDFESYFIIVADMVHYAKQHMLVGPSRGSAAGSLVCYTARITEIDPLIASLFFERFIDVSRKDLPDIDLDFPDNKRHMVFEYMAQKYGQDNVAHIGTVSLFKPKSALIQVCKALNIPPSATAEVKLAIIERAVADSRASNCLEDTLKETEPGRKFIKMYPQAMVASLLEGHASHTGVHAAGLLVCNDEIKNYATVDAHGIAHVDKHSAETLGLLKIDVLGLRTLGILEDSGVPVDWYRLPFDDEKTFDVFNQGRMSGIFQFEGNALRNLSSSIHFNSIREIDAVTALARPGPFAAGIVNKYVDRHAGAAYEPIHPKIDAIMKDTYGLPLYQEHTLAIVREIGKFGWDSAAVVRKSISKRLGKEFFKRFWEQFLQGAVEQGIPAEAAEKAWDMINAMGAWQMNKAHTYSYAVISYWTAYLKAHYPLEFTVANLRSAKDDESAIELLREMVRNGLQYEPFNYQLSETNWSIKNGKVIGGFMNLKGIGQKTAEKLVARRNAGEPLPERYVSAHNAFDEIFPMHRYYGDLYEGGPRPGLKVLDVVRDISFFNATQSAEDGSFLFIGELIHKNSRNANEEANVKKRNGKLATGPLEYLDIRLRDDTGMIGARIDRFNYERWGREILERMPLGAHLLVRARFVSGIRYAFIEKWKRLDA